MAFSSFTGAATNAAGLSRLVGLRFVPAQECRRFHVEITSAPSRQGAILPLSACSYWVLPLF